MIRAAAFVVAAALATAVPGIAAGQTRTWVIGALAESPELVVPVAILESRSDDGRDWSLSLVGWTLQGELSRRLSEHQRHFASLAITPRNADYSNYIYRDGRVDDDAAYRAASVRAAAGVEFRRRNQTTGRYAVIGDYRHVRDLSPSLADEWRRPFVGLEVSERWRQITATESFGTRITGVDVGALARVLVGDRTWSQLELDGHAGARMGRAFFQGDAGAFTGHGLDEVNAFLIGGSWHLADARLASGHRFGEYRLARAATVSGRASVRLIGPLEVGARVSAASGGNARRAGGGIEVRTVHSGMVIDVGVAWARVSASVTERRPVVYGQFTTAILQR